MRYRTRKLLLALGVERDNGVDGLQEGGNEQHYGSHEGDEYPGVAQVGVHKAGPPLISALPAVLVQLPLHMA